MNRLFPYTSRKATNIIMPLHNEPYTANNSTFQSYMQSTANSADIDYVYLVGDDTVL